MKVKTLIELLQNQNPEARVIIYSCEDMSTANKVYSKEENQGEDQLYCKGYSFSELEKEDSSDYVVISDW